VSFAEAVTVLTDPLAKYDRDPDHADRELAIGMSAARRVLVVVFSEAAGTVRIISSRPASRHERSQYEDD